MSCNVDCATFLFKTSTVETAVGKTDDNKLVYRRTISITSPANLSGVADFNVGATSLIDWEIAHVNAAGGGFITPGPTYIDNASVPQATFSVTVSVRQAYFSGVSTSFRSQPFRLTLYCTKD